MGTALCLEYLFLTTERAIYFAPFLFPQWCVENSFFMLRTAAIKKINLYNYLVKRARKTNPFFA